MYTRTLPLLSADWSSPPRQGSKRPKPPDATGDTLGSPALRSIGTGPRLHPRSRSASPSRFRALLILLVSDPLRVRCGSAPPPVWSFASCVRRRGSEPLAFTRAMFHWFVVPRSRDGGDESAFRPPRHESYGAGFSLAGEPILARLGTLGGMVFFGYLRAER
jgi:hypothetical protein